MSHSLSTRAKPHKMCILCVFTNIFVVLKIYACQINEIGIIKDICWPTHFFAGSKVDLCYRYSETLWFIKGNYNRIKHINMTHNNMFWMPYINMTYIVICSRFYI